MVPVKLVGSDGSSVEAKTDPKGFYSFSKSQIKPNTTYDLTVVKEGYFNKKALGKQPWGLKRTRTLLSILDSKLILKSRLYYPIFSTIWPNGI